MRVYLKNGSKSYVIPCKNVKAAVTTLKSEVLDRIGEKCDAKNFYLTLASNGAVLDDRDVIQEVLQDGDFLCLCEEGADGTKPATRSEDLSVPPLPNYEVAVYQTLSGEKITKTKWIELDGHSLSIRDLMAIGKGGYRVKLSQQAIEAVKQARKVIDDIVDGHKVVYGVTTGFGKFARVVIPEGKLVDLQESLIRSHSAGVGCPLAPETTRRLLALRINVLAKGYSGISLETLQQLIDALNVSCLSCVPDKGTVGASGDLAPLSHLALGLMGEGKMWSPESGWADAKDVLESHNLRPLSLKPKEGLALINGTQFITAIGSEAIFRAQMIARQADVIAALSNDVLQGTPRAYDYDIHASRPHPGQQVVAGRLRALLDSNIYPSQIREGHKNCTRVQDPYTMRCVPQVHGVVNDTIKFVKGIVTTEMNSALDNPMVLAQRAETISGGNFHGEYPAKALDYLAIGVHELANISERRLERLINPAYSELPAFLVEDGGLNSGFMIAHCTAAALVSENKVLAHPSSVDSLSTSAGTEDHVSMGGYAARKALEVVKHVEQVLAIELLAACQALEFHRPKKTTAPLEEVHALVRKVVKPWEKDRFFAPDIDAVTKLLREGQIWDVARPYIEKYEAESPLLTPALSSSPPKADKMHIGKK